jgi:uncharacterized protein YbcI
MEGSPHGAISNTISALYRQHYGRGPNHIKTYIQDDTVLCVLRGGSTRFEQALASTGRADTREAVRSGFQQSVADPFCSAIEEATGRTVEAYFSGTRDDPDISIEVFVLEGD